MFLKCNCNLKSFVKILLSQISLDSDHIKLHEQETIVEGQNLEGKTQRESTIGSPVRNSVDISLQIESIKNK